MRIGYLRASLALPGEFEVRDFLTALRGHLVDVVLAWLHRNISPPRGAEKGWVARRPNPRTLTAKRST